MGVQMSTGSRTRGRRNRRAPLAEINVTPFVDVMLVLLIVFMVTAPMMISGVSVDLPESAAAPINNQDKPLSVSIKKDGSIHIQNMKVKEEELIAKLKAVAKNRMDLKIYVRGDKEIAYGKVMQTMGRINAAGFSKVALITSKLYEQGKNGQG